MNLALIWPWGCAVLSGLLMALAFPPLEWDWLIWIALIPLVCALWFSRGGALRRLALGYVTGLVFFLTALFWLTEVTPPGWVVFALYLALYPAIWAWLVGVFGNPAQSAPRDGGAWTRSWPNLIDAAFGAAAWAGLEWVRATLFTGFPWNSLGVALHGQVALIQIADFAGVGGISFLIVFVTLTMVITVRRVALEFRSGRIRPHLDFSVAVALVAFAFAYGVRHYYADAPESVSLKVAAVQANIPQEEKWDARAEQKILNRYRELSETAIALDPELLIWPEAATPQPLLLNDEMKAVVLPLLESHGSDFLLGTVHYAFDGDFNSAVLLRPDGGLQIYHKMHLVPFGEFVPFRESFPLFAWAVGDQVPSDFNRGTEAVVMTMNAMPIRIAPIICFEDTVGDLVRQFVRRGAELLVTVTNDGWFRESSGSRHHLINSVFRCVENKRPMVRAANTGVTCFIDRLGQVTQTLESEDGNTFIEGVLFGEVAVPVQPPMTFYTLYGDLFSIVCFFGVLVSLRLRWSRAGIARIPLNTSASNP